jgi:hypothetical protein
MLSVHTNMQHAATLQTIIMHAFTTLFTCNIYIASENASLYVHASCASNVSHIVIITDMFETASCIVHNADDYETIAVVYDK